MAARTEKLIVTADTWTPITVASSYLAVQLSGGGTIRIHISDVPPADSNHDGIVISWNRDNTPSSFGAGNLPDGVGVYVRAADDNGGDEEITILTY